MLKSGVAMPITKDVLISDVAELGYPKNRSAQMVETLLEIVKSALERGEDILLSGFGKFSVKEKKDRRGRNPQTGEDLRLGPRRVVTFKCSRVLRERVNGKSD
jgi:integration host factor subunit alpha